MNLTSETPHSGLQHTPGCSDCRQRQALFSYAFPAAPKIALTFQALPLTVCITEPSDNRLQAAIWRADNEICVKLRSRKNMQRGSGVLRRGCTCSGIPAVCPVHVLWEQYLDGLPAGTSPWAGISPAAALRDIRLLLRRMNARLRFLALHFLHASLHALCKGYTAYSLRHPLL